MEKAIVKNHFLIRKSRVVTQLILTPLSTEVGIPKNPEDRNGSSQLLLFSPFLPTWNVIRQF